MPDVHAAPSRRHVSRAAPGYVGLPRRQRLLVALGTVGLFALAAWWYALQRQPLPASIEAPPALAMFDVPPPPAPPPPVPPPAPELISPAEPTASPPGGSPARARDRPRVVRQEPAPQLVERPPTPTVRLHADLPAAGLSAQRGEGLGGLEGLGSGAGPGTGADSGAGGTTGGVKRFARGRWVRQPTLADVLEVWPRRAARELHTPAQVRISCVIRKDSRVKSCELLSETPPGWGFGAAAIRLARRSLFQPIVVDGRYTEIPVIVPFTFQREAKPPRSPASPDPAPRATASPPPS